MSFLLNDERPDEYKSWLDYFDFVIVSAEKPAFFSAGNTLREVDIETGRLKIGRVTAPLQRGKVYTGGNLELLERLAGIKNGTEVLYVGDHIFADVRVSKKRHGWRTLLVIPELEHELEIWANKATQEAYNRLVTLSRAKDAIYRDLTSETKNPPNIKTLRKAIQKAIHDKNGKFNLWFGSLFTSGLKQSFFAMQVQRYADIYTSHYYNLLEYPIWYAFTAEPSLLPHELYI
jgi:5'-nucleotidase